jgi:cardiolipin synthase
LSDAFISALTPPALPYEPTPFIRHLNPLRRLHRKITVVDGLIAFVGGINFSEDQLESSGAKAKEDYAVRIEGPVVERIHHFVRQALEPVQRQLKAEPRPHRVPQRDDGAAASSATAPKPQTLPGNAEVAFVTRDNRFHRTDIEHAYRMAIRAARDTVLIANAYFFPGYRLLRDLRRAASRGVTVQLILQNDPDVPIARLAGRLLYDILLKDGVTIHEYCRREMHGKVAVVDDIWTTVGSSNLDPLTVAEFSQCLIRDAEFAATLSRRLQYLIEHECEPTKPEVVPRLTMWRYLLGAVAYHVSRSFPRWLSALPHFGARIRSFVRGRRIDTKHAVDASITGD